MPETMRSRIRGVGKPNSSIAILTALFVAAAAFCGARTVLALDEMPTPDGAPAPLDLRIAEKGVHGSFDSRPIFEILDALRRHASFEYEGDENSLNHLVSGKFDSVPLTEAVKQILEPTNYIIGFDAEGKIRSVLIGSLRRGSVEAATDARSQATNLGTVVPNAGTELELTSEERLLFETAGDGQGPPPELLDYFEPWQEPGTEETGPEVPIDMVLEDLPEFEPWVSEDGPVSPDIPVEDLPEFEPFVSETGPSSEPLEWNGSTQGTPKNLLP